nr:unnamed protein product [Digitaria exilis]
MNKSLIRCHGEYLLHPESAAGGGGGEERRKKKGDEPRHRSSGAGAATATEPTNRLSPDPTLLLPRPQGGAVFA